MNKFLLVGDKFMPEMNLIQTGFRSNTCRPFIRNKKKNKKIKIIGDSRYIYQK